jgi:hypothetical protein
MISHVGGQTLASGEAGPFSNQQDCDFRNQQFADLVEYSHPAMADDRDRTQTPSTNPGALVQEGQQTRNLCRDSGYGKTIADRYLKGIVTDAALKQLSSSCLTKVSSQIGTK